MRSHFTAWVVAAVVLGGGVAARAEDGKALPTLLIKGEIVSVDSTDPSALLVKVKDRYGFETPIFLQQDTKVSQGDASVSPTNLTAGTPVEVEYNFDVNTAKRHAVSVKVTPASAQAPAAPADAGMAAPAAPAAPSADAPVSPSGAEEGSAAPSASPDAAPAPEEAAPSVQ